MSVRACSLNQIFSLNDLLSDAGRTRGYLSFNSLTKEPLEGIQSVVCCIYPLYFLYKPLERMQRGPVEGSTATRNPLSGPYTQPNLLSDLFTQVGRAR